MINWGGGGGHGKLGKQPMDFHSFEVSCWEIKSYWK